MKLCKLWYGWGGAYIIEGIQFYQHMRMVISSINIRIAVVKTRIIKILFITYFISLLLACSFIFAYVLS